MPSVAHSGRGRIATGSLCYSPRAGRLERCLLAMVFITRYRYPRVGWVQGTQGGRRKADNTRVGIGSLGRGAFKKRSSAREVDLGALGTGKRRYSLDNYYTWA